MRTRRTTRRGPIRCLTPLAAALLFLAGCAPKASPPSPELIPKIRDLQSGLATDRPPGPAAPGVPVVLTVSRLEFPLEADLEAAWKPVAARGLPSRKAALWEANGLRAAVLERQRLAEFLKALPEPLAAGQRRIYSRAEVTPLPFGALLGGTRPITLTLPDGPPRVARLVGGKCQFLGRFDVDAGGQVLTQLVPHHQLPRASLLPVDPHTMELEGRRFDELALAVSLGSHQVLVVGLKTLEQPPPVFPAGAEASARAATQPAATQPAPARVFAAGDDLLGTWLLTHRVPGGRAQVLVVLAVARARR